MTSTVSVKVKDDDWYDLLALSGARSGILYNSGSRRVFIRYSDTKPDIGIKSGIIIQPGADYEYAILRNSFMWVRSSTWPSELTIAANIGATKNIGALATRDTTITSGVTVPIVPGDTSINLVSAASFAAGDNIHVVDGLKSSQYTYTIPAAPVGNVISLDAPVDDDFSIATTVTKVNSDFTSIIGSVAIPVVFSVKPTNNETWLITKFSLELTHSVAGDNADFGNITGGLTNGLLFRSVTSNGKITNIANLKTNGEIGLLSDTLTYHDKAGQGAFGTSATEVIQNAPLDISRKGAVILDSIEVVVQDDLTSLASGKIRFSGVARVA